MSIQKKRGEVFTQNGKLFILDANDNEYEEININALISSVNNATPDIGNLQTQIQELQQQVAQLTAILDAVIPVH